MVNFLKLNHFYWNKQEKLFSVIIKCRKLGLPLSLQIHLFDTMVAPILLYGSEVWGIENVNLIDQFQLKFYKIILKLKQSTPNCMIYGDLGILPLSIHINTRILCYWNKILNCKDEKINSILYRTSYKLYNDGVIKLPWISYVHDLLNYLGMTNVVV